MTLNGTGSYTNPTNETVADGIFAQSVGGGGGDGGLAVGALCIWRLRRSWPATVVQ